MIIIYNVCCLNFKCVVPFCSFLYDIGCFVIVDLNAGLVGLLMTYAIMLMGLFQWGVRQSAEVESQVRNLVHDWLTDI